MNQQQQKAFTWSLYKLSRTDDLHAVEIDLSELLAFDFMPNSCTKEDIANAYRALVEPCISLTDMGEEYQWIPAYQKVEWKGDIMLLEFNPPISKQVLKADKYWLMDF